ncbi:MAG: hypothetical protein WCP22_04565 [Chlamydiota bacterium]
MKSREEGRGLIESLRSAHEEMGHRLMADRARLRKKLTADYSALRNESESKAKVIMADLDEAGKLWSEAIERLEEMRKKRKE